MKKAIVLMSIVALLFVTNASYADSALKKLCRGAANAVTCPLEMGNGISDAFQENGVIAAGTWGVVDGFLRMVGRGACGIYELFTFVLPPYDPIIKKPEFLLENWFKG